MSLGIFVRSLLLTLPPRSAKGNEKRWDGGGSYMWFQMEVRLHYRRPLLQNLARLQTQLLLVKWKLPWKSPSTPPLGSQNLSHRLRRPLLQNLAMLQIQLLQVK